MQGMVIDYKLMDSMPHAKITDLRSYISNAKSHNRLYSGRGHVGIKPRFGWQRATAT